MTIQERVKAAREYAELDQAQLGKVTGVSQQAAQKWEGKGMPGLLRIPKIAKACGVRAEWLATGEGDMLNLDEINIMSHEAGVEDSYKMTFGNYPVRIKETQIQIPILDIEASGGMGSINDSELATDNMTLEKSYLHEFGLPTDNLKIITIRGDSMSPELESGDLVLVHNVPLAAHEMHDGMFVVLIEDMLYIKRLQRLPGKRIKVISTNREAYDPFEVACNDVDILGRVVFAWRGKKF